MSKAREHLEDAEATLLSHINQLVSVPFDAPDEEVPDTLPVLFALMRSISRALGALEESGE